MKTGVGRMKFKVGDKVRVREDLEVDREYGAQIFVDSMREYCGKVMEIEEVWNTGYILKEDVGNWVFTDDMLEPIEDSLTDKILERNNKQTLNNLYGKNELINHPTHYNQGSMETIEKIKLLLTEEEYRGFLKGNIIKYDDRMNHKGDAENDLRKSKWYAERLRSSYYGGTNPND